jgi:TolB protein
MRTRIVLATTMTVALAALAMAPAAHATYPGANGRIAFAMTIDGNTDIYSLLPNGHGLRRLTSDPDFEACAAYSADGQHIAYCRAPSASSPAGIWVMNQNGTGQHLIVSSDAAGRAGFPDFAPDGTKLAFICTPPGDTTAPDICTSDADGANLTRLTASPGLDLYPAWSPDGSKIVFESNRTGTMQVWVMNGDGSDQTQLTFDAVPKDQVPDWSPDGSRIAYTADTNPPGGQIMVMNQNGSNQHAITQAGHDYGPVWSPDGSQLALLDMASRDVEVINADGSGRYVLEQAGPQFVPAWQPHPADEAD